MKHRPKGTKGTANSNHDNLNDLSPFREDSAEECLTINQGLRINDDQNSLNVGERGPSLLEDFLLREKITHFDHERSPERISPQSQQTTTEDQPQVRGQRVARSEDSMKSRGRADSYGRWVDEIARGEQTALGSLYDATSRLVYGLTLRILGDTSEAEQVTGRLPAVVAPG